jgi:hypothetical protein
VADPFEALVPPSVGTASTSISCGNNSNQTVGPGTYTSISASGNCNLTFLPGVYVITSGGLSFSGTGVITGEEVMIYNNAGGISISGNGSFNLTPPSSEPFAGVTIFHARQNSTQIAVSGNGSGLQGVIYARGAELVLSGNGRLNMTMVVDRLKLSGAVDVTDPNPIVGVGQLNTPQQGSLLHNPTDARDVNGDGYVTPQDALVVINRLNRHGSQSVAAVMASKLPGATMGFYDVDGDGVVAPMDVLVIYNFFGKAARSSGTSGAGEGEAAAIVADDLFARWGNEAEGLDSLRKDILCSHDAIPS